MTTPKIDAMTRLRQRIKARQRKLASEPPLPPRNPIERLDPSQAAPMRDLDPTRHYRPGVKRMAQAMDLIEAWRLAGYEPRVCWVRPIRINDTFRAKSLPVPSYLLPEVLFLLRTVPGVWMGEDTLSAPPRAIPAPRRTA